jgi:putative endopeptidase
MPRISSSPAALIILSGLLLSTSACGEEPLQSVHFGTWGFDISGEDATIEPGDDFFEFANGGWLARTPIPTDKTGMSIDVLVDDLTEVQLRRVMKEAAQRADREPKDLEGKVGAFYRAFMDENRIEALGSTPIEIALTAIHAATTHEQLGRLMGRSTFDFEGTFFGISVDADPKDPTRYAIFLSQGGLGLRDRDYYLQRSFAAKLAKYQQYVEQLWQLVGWPDAPGNAARIVAIETRIALVSWTKAEERDPNNTYNPLTVSELEAFAPGFPWKQFLTEARLASTDQVIILEKARFRRSQPFSPTRQLQLYKLGSRWRSSITQDSISPSHSPTRTSSFEGRHFSASRSGRLVGSGPSTRSVVEIVPKNASALWDGRWGNCTRSAIFHPRPRQR